MKRKSQTDSSKINEDVEDQIMSTYERLIAIHHGQKYKGMYKNVLEANRRSNYINRYEQKYGSRRKSDGKRVV